MLVYRSVTSGTFGISEGWGVEAFNFFGGISFFFGGVESSSVLDGVFGFDGIRG